MRWNCYLLSVAPLACLALIAPVRGQDTDPVEPPGIQNVQPVEPSDGITNDRILGVIPNFQTVSDPKQKVPALTSRQKFNLFVKETVDPYTFASAAAGAGISQAENNTPKYGDGMESYSQRLGAAYVDMATQNFFSDYFLATVLHEDPRYYRMGPSHSVARRIYYSLTRLVITKTDKGTTRFNFSNVGGMAMGIALSNAYYPEKSVSGSVTSGRFTSSMTASALGNLLPEFWPDFKEKLAHWRHK
jgi:hypothetical protein